MNIWVKIDVPIGTKGNCFQRLFYWMTHVQNYQTVYVLKVQMGDNIHGEGK